jgi:pyridoxine kinase
MKNDRQKRVLAIHDISAFGRCSLTVALPIISAAGVETTVLPTAVLSTHTGGFTGFTYRDLSADIMPIIAHWKTLNLTFDALYSGFLGSFEQIEMMETVFKNAKKADNLIIVDPVMADNGKLYTIFSKEFPAGMARLAALADILMPNITEACLILGETYKEPPYDKSYIDGLLKKLQNIGVKNVVLTGVTFNPGELGAAALDETGSLSYFFMPFIDGYYHGTGDIFGSALVGALLNGKSLAHSSEIAVKLTHESILRTKNAGTDIRFGVNFEQSLPAYMRNLGIVK